MVLYKICRELAFVCYIEFFAITRYVITRVECMYVHFAKKKKNRGKVLTRGVNLSLAFTLGVVATGWEVTMTGTAAAVAAGGAGAISATSIASGG